MEGPSKAFLIGGLIEQESCISLKHSKCWDPRSRLKTPREEGAGLFQITKTYTSSGSIRFDALEELRTKYRPYLYELTWYNIYERPDLQIRAGILKLKDTHQHFKQFSDALAFTDAAYNGGISGVTSERRACYISNKCNPDKWFDNVENYCMKSKVALYGNRSACDINREHVRNVLNIRSIKYTPYFK